MDNLGSYLKSKREERGIALEEIASITKIHIRNLELIEHSQWKSLPPEPFIRGFLSAYSRYVGMDPKEVLEKYRGEVRPAPPPTVLEAEVPAQTSDTLTFEETAKDDLEEKTLAYELPEKKINLKIWIASTIAAALLITVPFLFTEKSHSHLSKVPPKTESKTNDEKRESVQSLVSKAIPEKAEEVKKEESPTAANLAQAVTQEPVKAPESRIIATEPIASPAATTAVAPAPVAAPAPAPAKEEKKQASQNVSASAENKASSPVTPTTANHTLVVKVKDKSWSKVVIDGNLPVQKILSPDETYTYTAQEKIKLVLGNSAGAEILHNGEKSDGTKIDGIIRQFIFPANSRFPQDPPKRKVATDKPADAEVNPTPSDSEKATEEN